MVWRSPQAFPRLSAFENPDRGVVAPAMAFETFEKVVIYKARQPQETTFFRLSDCSLELPFVNARLKDVFVNAEDSARCQVRVRCNANLLRAYSRILWPCQKQSAPRSRGHHAQGLVGLVSFPRKREPSLRRSVNPHVHSLCPLRIINHPCARAGPTGKAAIKGQCWSATTREGLKALGRYVGLAGNRNGWNGPSGLEPLTWPTCRPALTSPVRNQARDELGRFPAFDFILPTTGIEHRWQGLLIHELPGIPPPGGQRMAPLVLFQTPP